VVVTLAVEVAVLAPLRVEADPIQTQDSVQEGEMDLVVDRTFQEHGVSRLIEIEGDIDLELIMAVNGPGSSNCIVVDLCCTLPAPLYNDYFTEVVKV
jgi:hypothetical protein